MTEDKKSEIVVNWDKWNRIEFINGWKCFFGFHSYPAWEDTKIRTEFGLSEGQVRWCRHCNKKKLRFVDHD